MLLQAVRATPGAWVDTDVPVRLATVHALRSQGKKGIFRYGPLPHNRTDRDLSADELADICGGGLECTILQHVREGLWRPSEHSSELDASTIVEWALRIGLAIGVHLGLDLESIDGTAYETIVYAVGWQRKVLEAGYRAMLYHGFSVPPAPADLFELPGFDCYFTDPVQRPIPTRGNAVVQGKAVVIDGTEFDEDTVAPDLLGGLPFVASAA